MPTELYLSFDSDDDRDLTVKSIKALGTIPDAELEAEEGDEVKLTIDADDPRAALARSEVILRGALDGTGLSLDRVPEASKPSSR